MLPKLALLRRLYQSHHNHPSLRHLISPITTSPSPQPQQEDNDEEQQQQQQVSTILHIITTSPTPQSLSDSLLSNPQIPLSSPPLIDAVLKRARFSHTNPFRTLHFFNLILSSTTPSPSSFDTMLYILGRSRRFQECWSLLLHMKRSHNPSLISPRTLQIVLSRIAKVCSLSQTLLSFKKFKKLISPFDTACFNALLRSLAQEKSMSDARTAYHSLKHLFRPDLQTFNILLSGWKSAADADSFFAEMTDLGVAPDLVTYNSLVDVYCKNKDLDKARQLIEEMRSREIYPDVITYTSLIGGLGLAGQPDKARELLRDMRELGCGPDVAAYNATIRNFCIAKRLGDALALVKEMGMRGLAPNATTYNLFFRVFYWGNDLESAWRMYGRMKEEGCLPNTQSCMFLVRLFRRREKVGMALELWRDMVEKEFGSFTLVSDVLFDLLCDLGKLEEAERCFMEMVEKGQKPSSVSFRRIKVLMELANKHDSIRKLSEKMEMFGNSLHINQQREEKEKKQLSF